MSVVLALLINGPAVDRTDFSGVRDHRKHDPASQMLVAGFAQDAQSGQPLADYGTFLAVGLWEPQAQGAINEADLEGCNGILVFDAAFLEIAKRSRVLLQALVVVVHDLTKRRLVIGVRCKRGIQPRHGRFLDRRSGGWPGQCREFARLQKLEGVPEGNAVEALHELDHVARRSAAHAPPQALRRGHSQTRIVILVEGTQASQIVAGRL